jgi:Ca-activated chloride channel family protein
MTALGAAQERGLIAVTVTDNSGAVLPGVTVTIAGPDARKCVTNERGICAFVGVMPGAYTITVELIGFTTMQHALTLNAGGSERVKLAMSVGTLSETVTVTGAAPMETVSSAMPRATPPPPAYRIGGRLDGPRWEPRHDRTGEAYDRIEENQFRSVSTDPLSTFSIDVDTASYANVRRFLNEGTLPPPEAVRIEELINYFHFDYPQPTGDQPFSITTELSDCPWNPKHRLALIGLQGRQIAEKEVPARNLVFLVDVSGSMNSPDKLPLVRHGLAMLADVLTAKDRVAIVVYAGASGVVLESTPGDRKARIERAIENLQAGGSTNGGAGITLAYKMARESFIQGGVNRVILATDGDFNVGVTDQEELVRLIERERRSGVFLSVLGVGTGNLKDSTMEKLADKGNGNYAYLDSLYEAHRVLVKEAGSTLVTIAKDVKIQVEFNPQAVSEYRLIGYENRILRDQDFNDDRKDAGEIGAGHTVTAVYEIVPAGTERDRPRVDPLKYGPPAAPAEPARAANAKFGDELLTVKLRYKAPDADVSKLTSTVIVNRPQPLGVPPTPDGYGGTRNLGFASSVAEAGMLLRRSDHAGTASYASAIARARKFRGGDPDGYRAEFVRLMELASSLAKRERTER